MRFGVFLDEVDGQVTINKVGKDSPAMKAGLLAKDRIIRLNGRPISSRHTLVRLTRELEWGVVATMTVVRDGAEMDVEIELVQ